MEFSRLRQIYTNPNISITQDELLEWLEKTRNSAWDIPSALGSLCTHLDLDEFPMHYRNWGRGYPNLEKLTIYTNNSWDYLDGHFREEHNLDLSDERINWEFDT